jgi:hypothetical protein
MPIVWAFSFFNEYAITSLKISGSKNPCLLVTVKAPSCKNKDICYSSFEISSNLPNNL